ncbi:MAG: hypothetical protein AAGC77_06840 [Pseudomonadota bacterium]
MGAAPPAESTDGAGPFIGAKEAIMGLKTMAVVSLPGDGRVNEDFQGSVGAAAWVLDGATGVGEDALDAPSDAYWFVRTFGRRLESALTIAPKKPYAQLIRDSTLLVKREFDEAVPGPAPDYPPSAAFILVRVISAADDGIELELAALGDCAAYVRTVAGAIEGFDGAGSTPIDTVSLDALKRAHRDFPDASTEVVSDLLRPVLQSNRQRMNTPDGYWILSFDERAADHLVTEVKLVDPTAPIILASDGFTRAIDMLGLETPEAFYARVINDGPDAVARDVRAIENSDTSCRRYPRLKCRDDATCVVLSVDGAGAGRS